MTMRYFYSLAIGFAVLCAVLALPVQASAATTYYTQAQVAVRLQALIAQLQDLQRQLAELRGGTSNTSTDVSRADVELFNDYAEVEIRYRNGDRDEFLFDADTRDEVIDFLVDETDNSRTHLLSVTYFSNGDDDDDDNDHNDIDDIHRIDVEIRGGDAYVDVRFEDGDRDSFTIEDETDEDTIIAEIADELGIDEDDIDDLIDFESDADEIDEIEVTIFDDEDEAEATVRFEDGSSDEYDFDTTDEDEIIEELADELNLSEDDVEDLVDFEYDEDSDEDIDEIEVTIDETDDEATAEVHFEDGGTTTYRFDTDDRQEIIEELADLLDMDEDDVEDLIEFDEDNSDEDVDEIEVTIFEDEDEAEATVRFEDGSSDEYDFDTSDEDEIIEELADELNMDEDDVEDLVDFEYED